MASDLPTLNAIERLSPAVIRILGGNPGKFTLQGTNTYLIGRGAHRILLDTGAGEPVWLSSLTSVLRSERSTIDIVLLSHWHPDHTSGVLDVASVAPHAVFYKHDPSYRGDTAWHDIADGQCFSVEGATLHAVHSPGHTQDHMVFLLAEEDAMFTADNVLGHGTAVFEDLSKYMDSLEIMRTAYHRRAYPGHGDVIEDGPKKIEDYIKHRKQREKQVEQVLTGTNDAKGNSTWTTMEIVKIIYRDVPESLHAPAESGVRQILHKLKAEKRVKNEDNGDYWQLLGDCSL